ncbi:phosphoribosyltransferase [Mycobacterium sp. 1245111.1]|uniref:phosphoribosyltransferase n=1 Tax=Mycobacterium sp. 1245111.1 TaxID=1834073 RepID=UPI0035131980
MAYEVAKAFGAPLDFLVVRELPVPFETECAFGAIAEGGIRVLNAALVKRIGLTEADITQVDDAERSELERQVTHYRDGRERISLADRTALIVDDGVATGIVARAACAAARAQGAARVVFAAPLGSPEAVQSTRSYADNVVCLETPPFYFFAKTSTGYRRFRRTTDSDIVALLAASHDRSPIPSRHVTGDKTPVCDEEIRVLAGDVPLATPQAITSN